MEVPSKFAFLLVYLLTLFLQISNSERTITVDGVSQWKDPTVFAGDTISFKHRYNYSLFIFRSERAFQLCNFTQATMLTKPNSTTFTWHPSRPGFFYFSFNNGSAKPCQQGQKLAVKVTLTPPSTSFPSPEPLPETSQAPIPGGTVSSSPAFPWPFRPRESLSPSSAPLPAIISSPSPENGDGDGGMPFLNSNPAVPLPMGAVDSATIRPVSTSSGLREPTPQKGGPGAMVESLHCALEVASSNQLPCKVGGRLPRLFPSPDPTVWELRHWVVGFSAIYKVLCCVLFMMVL